MNSTTRKRICDLAEDISYANALKYLINSEDSITVQEELFSCVCESNVLVGISVRDSFFDMIDKRHENQVDKILVKKYQQCLVGKLSYEQMLEVYIALLSEDKIIQADKVYSIVCRSDRNPYLYPVFLQCLDSSWISKHIRLMLDRRDVKAINRSIDLVRQTVEFRSSLIENSIENWLLDKPTDEAILVIAKLISTIEMNEKLSSILVQYILNNEINKGVFFSIVKYLATNRDIPTYEYSEEDVNCINAFLGKFINTEKQEYAERYLIKKTLKHDSLTDKIDKRKRFLRKIISVMSKLGLVENENTDNISFTTSCPRNLQDDILDFKRHLATINAADYIDNTISQQDYSELHKTKELMSQINRTLRKYGVVKSSVRSEKHNN